jgi:hypothetical protein
VDEDAPDNELLPDDPPAKLIETFVEAREGFPDLSVTVEDVMAEEVRVAAASLCGASTWESSRNSLLSASGWRIRPSTCSMSPVARSWSTGDTATIRPTSCTSLVFLTFPGCGHALRVGVDGPLAFRERSVKRCFRSEKGRAFGSSRELLLLNSRGSRSGGNRK